MQNQATRHAISRMAQRPQAHTPPAALTLTPARVEAIAQRHTAYADQALCLRGSAVQDFARDLLAAAGVKASL